MEEEFENNIKNITLIRIDSLVPKIEPEDKKDVPVTDPLSSCSDDNRILLSGEDLFQSKEVKIVLKDCKEELEILKIKNEPEDYDDANESLKPVKVEDQNINEQPNNDSACKRKKSPWVPQVISSSPTESSILGLPENISENVPEKVKRPARYRINYRESSPSECGSDRSYDPHESLSDLAFTKKRSSKNRKTSQTKVSTKKKTSGKEKVKSNSSSTLTRRGKTLSKTKSHKSSLCARYDNKLKNLSSSLERKIPSTSEHSSSSLKENIPITSVNSTDPRIEEVISNSSSQGTQIDKESKIPEHQEQQSGRPKRNILYTSIRQKDSGIKQVEVEVDYTLWSCCGVQFEEFSAFIDHNAYEHSVDKLSCSICIDQSFPSYNAIEKHYIDVHTDSAWKSFHCLDCRLVFGVKSSFLDHKAKCNESLSVCSGILDSIIDFAAARNQLKQTKISPKSRFKLSCCENVIMNFKDFIGHKVMDHNIPRLTCGLCSCEKDSETELRNHYQKFHFSTIWKKLDLKYLPDTKETIYGTSNNMADVELKSNPLQCSLHVDGILCQCGNCTKLLEGERRMSKHIMKTKKRFQCPQCSLSFHHESRLKRHFKTHEGVKSFPCDMCGSVYTQITTLKAHKQQKHTSNPFQIACHICNKIYCSKAGVKTHIANVHSKIKKKKGVIECVVCKKTLASKKSFDVHFKRIHSESEKLTCDHCGKSFNHKSKITCHIIKYHIPISIEKRYECQKCNITFLKPSRLRSHYLKNHSGKLYNCGVCGRIFNDKMRMKKHSVTHSDDRPFICQTCGKSFKRDANLLQHQYTHSDNRPHVCDICGKTFRLRTHVKQHMAVHGAKKRHRLNGDKSGTFE